MTTFRIVYEQALEIDELNRVAEVRPWTRLELGYAAIQSGWFGKFRPHWLDLAALEVIGLHARPLQGEDFDLLRDLGLVDSNDLNRLYARITDVAVADILGCSRQWVNNCAARLGDKGLLRVLPLPAQFRDSRGKFAGSNAYLLSGQVLVQSNVHRVNSVNMDWLPRVNSVNTAGLHRVNSVTTKNITLSSTLSNGESGSRGDPAADNPASEMALAPDGEHAGDRLTLDPSGNVAGAYRTKDAAEPASEAHRLRGTLWQRLNAALVDEKVARAFESVLAEIEANLGFSEIGLRAARLAFTPLPERRRRVLDDLRRMQGNATLKPRDRQRNVIGILTQNIGVVLGLGLTASGHLRMLAERTDYTVIGGLVKQYGAEALWLTACEIAGQRFEGDPLDYLRAALRNKHEREKFGAPTDKRSRGSSGLGRFDEIDYSQEEVA
jgi:hypothetical protein